MAGREMPDPEVFVLVTDMVDGVVDIRDSQRSREKRIEAMLNHFRNVDSESRIDQIENPRHCPFCGGDASLAEPDGYESVLCHYCDAEGPPAFNAADAARNWNRRRPPRPDVNAHEPIVDYVARSYAGRDEPRPLPRRDPREAVLGAPPTFGVAIFVALSVIAVAWFGFAMFGL